MPRTNKKGPKKKNRICLESDETEQKGPQKTHVGIESNREKFCVLNMAALLRKCLDDAKHTEILLLQ